MKYGGIYYIDTNVFLYATNPESPHFNECKKLLSQVLPNEISVTTSVETLQEVIHVTRRLKQGEIGVRIAKLILKQYDNLLDIDSYVIEKYLYFVEKYPKSDSRDLLHLAVCVYNGIRTIITIDKDFKAYKEVVAMRPSEIK